MTEAASNIFRGLPSVDRLLNHPRCAILLTRYNRDYVTEICRAVVDEARTQIRNARGQSGELSEATILSELEKRITRDSQPGHIRVVNASGTILHTNLGRAALPDAAVDAMTAVAR